MSHSEISDLRAILEKFPGVTFEGSVDCDGCGCPPKPLDNSTSSRSSDLRSLTAAARDGCQMCSLLEEGVSHAVAENKDLPGDSFIIRLDSFGKVLVWFRGTSCTLSFFTSPSRPDHPLPSSRLSILPIGYQVPGNTESDETFSWALKYLKRCSENHLTCNATAGSPLPDRVLDLGNSHDQNVKLYLSQTEVERYACLSHCWGTLPLLQTLSTNLSSHQQGVAWDSLPRTYQETITFVRRLQIRYLWIDSLCIVQDDEGDWQQQAAKMASIYQGAFLTISATRSPENGNGLFSVIAGERTKSHRLSCLDRDGLSQEFWVRPYMDHFNPGSAPNTFPHNSQMALFKRGWAFQERLLSSRILHFGTEELTWECLEDFACECSGIVTKTPLKPGITSLLKPYYSFTRLSSLNKEELGSHWQDLVEEYTTLQLTYDRDIFPAISGIAKFYKQFFQCQYFAGLWEMHLLDDLLWGSDVFNGWPCRPEKWRAPTWSWASVKCPVSFNKGVDVRNACTVIGVDCSPVGPDPTGELNSGILHLHGKLLPTILRYPWVPGTKPYPQRPLPILCTLDILSESGGNANADYNFLLPGPGFIKSGETVYCFYIGQDKRNSRPTDHFLVLRCMDAATKTFERIGCAESFNLVDLKIQDLEDTLVKIV